MRPTNKGDSLAGRIEDRSATVSVVGLGSVGMPLAVAFAEAGFRVTGVDVDAAKVDALNAGRCDLPYVREDRVRTLVQQGRFSAAGAPAGADCTVICVPTPLSSGNAPDVRFVAAAAEKVGARLQRGQLVVLESTVGPGTVQAVLKPGLERSGLLAGPDFHLAYSPERFDPGNTTFGLKNTPKLVAGLTGDSAALASALYRTVVDTVVPIGAIQVAELAKLFENVFRFVNIALVNELKMICNGLEIDPSEVLSASATKPFGFMRFEPGPGVGGMCIPINPHYFLAAAREAGVQATMVEAALRVNGEMPGYAVDRLRRALERMEKRLSSSRVLVIGVSYKRGVSDVRGSAAVEILRLLAAEGAQVSYHDPHVPELAVPGSAARLASVPLTAESVGAADAVLIGTDHREAVDYGLLLSHAKLIVDTRNAIAPRTDRDGRVIVG